MATTFDRWLTACAAARKGGSSVIFVATRGRSCSVVLDLSGDWTGATMAAYVKQAPDAAGDPLVNFTVTGPVVTEVGGAPWSAFTLTLADGSGADSTGALPPDNDADGIVELPLFITLAASGGSAELLIGGIMRVLGS